MPSNKLVQVLIKFGFDRKSTGDVKRGVKSVDDTLKKVEDQIERTGKKMKAGFDSAGKAGQGLGAVLGAAGGLEGVVAGLTAKFIELAQVAIAKINEIKNEAVDLAAEMEQNTIVFSNIFGDEETATQFLAQLREEAVRLGVSFGDASRFAKSLLPDTASMEQFTQLLELAATGARDANLPLEELIFSFNELAAGDFTSIRDRLDIPRDVIARIREVGQSTGDYITPAIEEIGKLFEKRGVDIGSFADTYQAAMDRVNAQTESFKMALGDPVFEQRKESFKALGDVLTENADDYQLIAARVGDIIAAIEEFFQTNFLEALQSVDSQKVLELLDALFELVETGKLLANIILGVNEDFNILNTTLDIVLGVINAVNDALMTASQISAIVRAGWAVIGAETQNAAQNLQVWLGRAEEAQHVDPYEAARKSMEDSLKTFEDFNRRQEEDVERQRERRRALDETSEKLTSFEGTLLAVRKAEEEAAKAAAKYEEAQKKLAEATEKINTESKRRLEEIDIKAERDRLKALEAAAQRREDIERKNVRRIEDVWRKFNEEQVDQATDLSREEQDILRKAGQQRMEIDRDAAKARADLERDTAEEIRRIRQQFDEQIEDAVRNQDAVAFLRAQRQGQQAEQEAQRNREIKRQDIETGRQAQLEDLRQQQAQELEQARITNQRKLEDLQQRLSRELEENQRKLDQELADQEIAEQRKQQQLEQSYQQQLADHQRYLDQKQQDLEKSLADELKTIEEYEAKKQQAKQKAAASTPRPGDDSAPWRKRRKPGQSPVIDPYSSSKGLQAGGYAGPGMYELGEGGREFVLSNATTTAAEGLLGGSLTQRDLLAAMASGGLGGQRNINYNPQYNFSERDDARLIMAQISQEIDEKLLRLERGY